MFNQYYINQFVYNPSYVGFDKNANVTLIRNQKWTDYSGGFITNYVSVGTMLKDEKSGIGIDLYSDYVGITSKLKANLAYSYRIQLGEKMNLRAGVSAGVIDNRINFSDVFVNDPNDPLLVNLNYDRKTSFNLNAGINFTYDEFQFGIAVPQAIGQRLVYNDEDLYYTLGRQYIANTSYRFLFNQESENNKMSLRPDILAIYTPGLPFNYNGSLIFEMDKYGWIGATYKSDYAIGINLGINMVPNLKIGLAYDYQISAVASYNSVPNVEILLHYRIPTFIKEVKEPEITNNNLIGDDKDKISQEEHDAKVRELNKKIQILEDSLKNRKTEIIYIEKEDTTSKKPVSNEEIKDYGIKKNENDHFLEILDKSESPNGYYVVVGAFGKKQYADELLAGAKDKFPNARIIFNERNELYYVILFYSPKFEGVKEAYSLSHTLEGGRFQEAWVLQYFGKK